MQAKLVSILVSMMLNMMTKENLDELLDWLKACCRDSENTMDDNLIPIIEMLEKAMGLDPD